MLNNTFLIVLFHVICSRDGDKITVEGGSGVVFANCHTNKPLYASQMVGDFFQKSGGVRVKSGQSL